jgi:hypothetical protein
MNQPALTKPESDELFQLSKDYGTLPVSAGLQLQMIRN